MKRALSRMALLGLLACNHQDPFPDGRPPRLGPRSTTPPVRLTYSSGSDLSPTWTSDGRVIAYALMREGGGRVGDRCLGGMPAAGGTRYITKCLVAADTDTVRALGPVAAGPGNRLVWVDARSLRSRVVPDHEGIRVGTLGEHDTGVQVRSLPYRASSGVLHVTATSLTWLNPDHLAYVANDRILLGCGRGCLDTILIAREVALLDLTTSPPAVAVLPGSSEVTSVAAGDDGASLYLTRAGDSRVYRRVLATGTESVAHDFAAGGIARDVSVRGTRLTAVVGGAVSYGFDSTVGFRQVDGGGALMRVDLLTGEESAVDVGDRLVQHPALSPDGTTAIVEVLDPVGRPRADLWLVRLP